MAGDIAVLASALLPAEVTSSVQIYEDVAGKAGACKRCVRGIVNSADLGRQCKTLNIDGQWATRYDFIQQGRALGDDLYKNSVIVNSIKSQWIRLRLEAKLSGVYQ